MKTVRSVLFLGLWWFITPAVHAGDKPTTKDLVTPEMTTEEPAAGRRVRQVAPEYQGTEVCHVLYLPLDWKLGDKYSVIVEYTGKQIGSVSPLIAPDREADSLFPENVHLDSGH